MTHPLRARLLLLALAAALALSVAWAMAVAESRDVDGAARSSAVDMPGPAQPDTRAVRVANRR